MIKIPLVDQNDFVIEVVLDEVTYFLRFSWNSEAQMWVLGIADANQVDVLQGIAIVPNVLLLGNYRQFNVPAGELAAYSDDDTAALGRDSFLDGTFTFLYLTEAEYAAL